MPHPYRPEIDGLRAIAVLAVIAAHAGAPLRGGFLGVDIFFAISGFLITRILMDELGRGAFSLRGFYLRRVRRLGPALCVVVLACLPAAWVLMTPGELAGFGQSLVATVLLVPNLFFWRESGYFAPAAETLPLLHLWSLGVEEQFYLLFPLALALVWRRGWLVAGLGGAAVLSLLAAEAATRIAPDAAFYMLPFRAWELLAGALGAVWLARAGAPRAGPWLALAGLGLIVASLVAYHRWLGIPGLWLLAPVGGTVLVLVGAGGGGLAARLLGWRPLRAVGLISYSAYLWHQPVFAFARLSRFDPPGPLAMTGLVVVTLALAWATWRLVEQPLRHGPRKGTLPARPGLLGRLIPARPGPGEAAATRPSGAWAAEGGLAAGAAPGTGPLPERASPGVWAAESGLATGAAATHPIHGTPVLPEHNAPGERQAKGDPGPASVPERVGPGTWAADGGPAPAPDRSTSGTGALPEGTAPGAWMAQGDPAPASAPEHSTSGTGALPERTAPGERGVEGDPGPTSAPERVGPGMWAADGDPAPAPAPERSNPGAGALPEGTASGKWAVEGGPGPTSAPEGIGPGMWAADGDPAPAPAPERSNPGAGALPERTASGKWAVQGDPRPASIPERVGPDMWVAEGAPAPAPERSTSGTGALPERTAPGKRAVEGGPAPAAVSGWPGLAGMGRRFGLQRWSVPGLVAATGAGVLGVGLACHLGGGFAAARFTPDQLALLSSARPSPMRSRCHAPPDRAPLPAQACVYFADAPPGWAVMGDSHAVEIAFALAEGLETRGESLVHLSASGCPPALGFETDLRGCRDWVARSLAWLEAADGIHTVVLVWRHSAYLFGQHNAAYPGLPDTPYRIGGPGDGETLRRRYWAGFRQLVARLGAAGRRVVVVEPVPELPRPIGAYVRHRPGRDDAGRMASVPRPWYAARNAWVLARIEALAAAGMAERLAPAARLCDARTCYGGIGAEALYFDDDHPSLAGARRIVAPLLTDPPPPAPRIRRAGRE